MKDLVLNAQTRQQLEAFTLKPAHALMVVGPIGSGKRTLAIKLAEAVLGLRNGGFADHPYALLIAPEEGKAIGIEAARKLEQFLALKVPGKTAHDRVIIIEDAHLLTVEAQNALLKTLEEPPAGTILILTANHEQTVLPTIRSRAQVVPVGRLEKVELHDHFKQNFDDASIEKAYAISGGLPGLMHALLNDADHPLVTATEKARELLSRTGYERLAMVDELTKQKALALNVTVILQQMARVALQNAQDPVARRWCRILEASYEAGEALTNNAQPKLVLTKLMLNL